MPGQVGLKAGDAWRGKGDKMKSEAKSDCGTMEKKRKLNADGCQTMETENGVESDSVASWRCEHFFGEPGLRP
jgi:hypothetical protein